VSAPTPRETARAVDVAFKVPGLYKRDEARYLYELARRKGDLVEIGCYLGRSTAILVQAARVWGARVTSVDPFVALPPRFEQATADKWRSNLRAVGLEPPELLEMPSSAAVGHFERPIAMLFIDGDHEYAGVREDLARWTPKVQVGGVVALHDMFFPSITGVCQAVTEWWVHTGMGGRWQAQALHDFTIAFRRVR
jgi:predicted O-methyltransferase YrrM